MSLIPDILPLQIEFSILLNVNKYSFVLLLVFFVGLPLPSVYATSKKVPAPVLKTLKQLEIPASSLSIYVHDIDKKKMAPGS